MKAASGFFLVVAILVLVIGEIAIRVNRTHSYSVSVEITHRYKGSESPASVNEYLAERLRNIGGVEDWIRILECIGGLTIACAATLLWIASIHLEKKILANRSVTSGS